MDMLKDELIEFRKVFENKLKNDILTYWIQYSVDRSGEGFYGAVDLNNHPVNSANRLGVPYLEEPADDHSPYYRNDWKIDPWKCPYHNGRAMMELIQCIDQLLNTYHL